MGYREIFKKIWKRSDNPKEITFRLISRDNPEYSYYSLEYRYTSIFSRWKEIKRFTDLSVAEFNFESAARQFKPKLKSGSIIKTYTPADQVAYKLKGGK